MTPEETARAESQQDLDNPVAQLVDMVRAQRDRISSLVAAQPDDDATLARAAAIKTELANMAPVVRAAERNRHAGILGRAAAIRGERAAGASLAAAAAASDALAPEHKATLEALAQTPPGILRTLYRHNHANAIAAAEAALERAHIAARNPEEK